MTNISEADVVKTYRRYAPVYDIVFGAVLEQGRRKMTQEVRRLAPGNLLEIGVGTGLTLARYPQTTTVTGIDISGEMLDRARFVSSQLQERQITLFQMDAEHLAFPDHSFDCVTVPYVLSVTPNPDQLTREIRRVCKPNGHILIVNHFSGQRGWKVLEGLTKSLADRIGFRSEFDFDRHVPHPEWTIISVETVNLLGLSRLVVLRNAA